MKLTIQQLVALSAHSWELERNFGFHMKDAKDFKSYIASISDTQLNLLLEDMSLLFRTVHEIGDAEIELKAEGHESLWAPLCKTSTAKAAGADENIVSAAPPDIDA